MQGEREEGIQDPLAAAIDTEVTADDADQSQEAPKQSTGSPVKAEDTVDTGSQHVIKVCCQACADCLLNCVYQAMASLL